MKRKVECLSMSRTISVPSSTLCFLVDKAQALAYTFPLVLWFPKMTKRQLLQMLDRSVEQFILKFIKDHLFFLEGELELKPFFNIIMKCSFL